MRLTPVLLLSLFIATVASAVAPATASLPRSTPEEQGVSSAALLKFVEQADEKLDALHSIIVVRHGKVIAEGWWTPYAPGEQHVLFSLSKSFTSTAVGLAVAEGRLSIDDPVLKFFPDEAPKQPSKNLAAMRVRDLLTMATGHHDEVISTFPYMDPESAVKRFFEMPVVHKPGTYFVYNTPASFMLSAIVQKVTGQSALEYLRPRLFEPLAIASPKWDANPQGISMGGFGLNLTTEDIAKFGQLYLQKGKWQDKQILPVAWVEQATRRQMSNGSDPKSDWEQGYGFQFWRSKHGSYRGDGAFGQFCLVLEKYDAVVAITSGTRDMGSVMNLVWDMVLPALAGETALAPDAAAQGKLTDKLTHLSLHLPSGQPASKIAASIAGRHYAFPTNALSLETVTFTPGDATGEDVVAVRLAGADQLLKVGHQRWIKGELKTPAGSDVVAASGAWASDQRYTLKVANYRTPFATTYTMRFVGDELLLDAEPNVSFGGPPPPQLVGKAQ